MLCCRQHIRRESRELWKAHTLRDFFEVRIPYEKKELKEPRNWRKVYIVSRPLNHNLRSRLPN